MFTLVDECTCNMSASTFQCCQKDEEEHQGAPPVPQNMSAMGVLGSDTVAMIVDSQLVDYPPLFLYESEVLQRTDLIIFGKDVETQEVVFISEPPTWIHAVEPPPETMRPRALTEPASSDPSTTAPPAPPAPPAPTATGPLRTPSRSQGSMFSNKHPDTTAEMEQKRGGITPITEELTRALPYKHTLRKGSSVKEVGRPFQKLWLHQLCQLTLQGKTTKRPILMLVPSEEAAQLKQLVIRTIPLKHQGRIVGGMVLITPLHERFTPSLLLEHATDSTDERRPSNSPQIMATTSTASQHRPGQVASGPGGRTW